MRKIETLMNAAIQSCQNMNRDNTSVISNDDVSFVYLHGSLIAMVGDTWLRLFDGGWRTKTTKSRLNAILQAHGNGESVYQKAGEWFLKTEHGSFPFVSGVRLA